MSNQPFGNVPTGPSPWGPQGATSTKQPSRIPQIIIGVIAVLGLGLGVASWLRPTHAEAAVGPAAPQYSQQQVADAKKNLCDAYDTMLRAIKSAGSLRSEDANQKFMLALNTRIAFNASGDYLFALANLNPAAPERLVTSIKNLSASYYQMILAQIEEAPKEAIDSIYRDMDTHENAVTNSCQ